MVSGVGALEGQMTYDSTQDDFLECERPDLRSGRPELGSGRSESGLRGLNQDLKGLTWV